MRQEFGATEGGFAERSSVPLMANVECPVLVLHGALDDRYPVEQAHLLDTKLTALGKSHETVIVPDRGHGLTNQDRLEYVWPFLKKWLQH